MKNPALKRILEKMILASPWKERYQEGFFWIGMPTILLNFVVQRILRVNGEVPWQVHYTSRVTSPENINIGKGVRKYFAGCGGCYVQALNGIVIGDNTIFAPGVKLISANHDQFSLAKHEPCGPITIGGNCWIGANAVVLPGVRLGDNCIVGAGAVVTKEFPSNSIIAGVPASLIGSRSSTPVGIPFAVPPDTLA